MASTLNGTNGTEYNSNDSGDREGNSIPNGAASNAPTASDLTQQQQQQYQSQRQTIQESVDHGLADPLSEDPNLGKRPRDARLIHMVLAQYGCSSYQERVPLQLMDFAYRYTSSILQDALHFTTEGYATSSSGSEAAGGSASGPGSSKANNSGSGSGNTNSSGAGAGGTAGGSGSAAGVDASNPLVVSANAVRLAIHSRTHYQYNPALPKEVLMDIAQERNRVALPPVAPESGSMRLPPEQYLLTGVGWELSEEYNPPESAESSAAMNDSDEIDTAMKADVHMKDDASPRRDNETKDQRQLDDDDRQEDEDVEGGTMEDVFGPEIGTGSTS